MEYTILLPGGQIKQPIMDMCSGNFIESEPWGIHIGRRNHFLVKWYEWIYLW